MPELKCVFCFDVFPNVYKFRSGHLYSVHGLSSIKWQCNKPLGYPVLHRYCELVNRSNKDRKNFVSLALHWFTAERERHLCSGYIRKVCGQWIGANRICESTSYRFSAQWGVPGKTATELFCVCWWFSATYKNISVAESDQLLRSSFPSEHISSGTQPSKYGGTPLRIEKCL